MLTLPVFVILKIILASAQFTQSLSLSLRLSECLLWLFYYLVVLAIDIIAYKNVIQLNIPVLFTNNNNNNKPTRYWLSQN